MNAAAEAARAREVFQSMARPFLYKFSLLRRDGNPAAEMLRETSPPLVRQQPTQRYHPARIREPQRAARAAAVHDHTRPRPVGHETRRALRVASLHPHLVLADLEALEIA